MRGTISSSIHSADHRSASAGRFGALDERGEHLREVAADLRTDLGGLLTDEDYARKVMGKELFEPEREVTAADAAKELIARTRPYPKAYVFAGLTAGAFLLMLFIASRY